MDTGVPPAGPADVDAAAHVFVERLDDDVHVQGEDGHHLARVRRVRPGETITAADGFGRWRVYRVGSNADGWVALHAESNVAHEVLLHPRLNIACALTKGERPELVVQKLTELGADAVYLVRAARSVVRWDASREANALDRLRRVAREAAAQCRRARLPLIDGPIATGELRTAAGLLVADRGGMPAAAVPLTETWTVAVGPEGGWDDAELLGFGAAPRLALGRFVLRAETAAIAAAAALAERRAPSASPQVWIFRPH
jgi:16S rRNA (uracil1498-N3)-methyltransferase